LFNDGLTEIEPYGFITDTPALGPTAKWNSLLLSATSVPATIAPIATNFAVRLLTINNSPELQLSFRTSVLRAVKNLGAPREFCHSEPA
jgi:hypothetical protein